MVGPGAMTKVELAEYRLSGSGRLNARSAPAASPQPKSSGTAVDSPRSLRIGLHRREHILWLGQDDQQEAARGAQRSPDDEGCRRAVELLADGETQDAAPTVPITP